MEMLIGVFGSQFFFLEQPVGIREKMLDLATSSAAVEFCLHIVILSFILTTTEMSLTEVPSG